MNGTNEGRNMTQAELSEVLTRIQEQHTLEHVTKDGFYIRNVFIRMDAKSSTVYSISFDTSKGIHEIHVFDAPFRLINRVHRWLNNPCMDSTL